MKVSICIPAYNQTIYLRKTLNSVLEQDFNDYEIIVTDDTTSDSVKKLIDEFDFQGRLRYFKNPQALGTPENWNEAIRQAKGKYIKIIHHDDFFTYNFSLNEFVKMLDENPESDFAFSSSLNLDKNFKFVNQHSPSLRQLELIKEAPDNLFFSAIIGSPSATIFRNNKSVSFDKSLKWLVDMDFYIRMLQYNGQFIYNEKPLITTVDAPLRVTHECINNQNVLINELIVVLKKIAKNSLKDVKFVKFLTSQMVFNRITSLKKLNIFIKDKTDLPFIIYPALLFSKIYIYILRKTPIS